ncbi:MAG: hypothetical protein ACRD2H_13055 [Terriglobales bacterium]
MAEDAIAPSGFRNAAESEVETHINPAMVPDVVQANTANRIGDFEVTDETDVAAAKIVPQGLSVRKPKRDEFFRVREDKPFVVFTLETQEGIEKVHYLISPAVLAELPAQVQGSFRRQRLFLAISKAGKQFLVPIPPDAVQSSNKWHTSLWLAIARAHRVWVRCPGDLEAGQRVVWEAVHQGLDPVFSAEPLGELVLRAFGGHIINDAQHPQVQRLLGAD